jgi:small acid-soluble spore protein H (minor)
MDVNRVKQILSSPANIPVEYHGVRVWIDSCDEKNGIASVHEVSNPSEKVQVKITELEEL